MSSKIRLETLGQLSHIEMGQAPSSEYVSDRHTDKAAAFIQGNAEFTDTYPNAQLWCSRPAKLARVGDSLISVRAPVGALNRADAPYCIGRGLAAVHFTRIDPTFGHYQLALRSRELQRLAQGSTFDAIGSKELKALIFAVPGAESQRKIAEILDTLDQQIRLQTTYLAKLELIEQGVVDKVLTPNRSVRESMRAVRLEEIASVERGKFGHRPRNDPRYLVGAHPFIQTGDVTAANGGIIESATQSLNERGAAVSKEFPAGTIAVTIAANIADTAILGRPMYFPDSIVGVTVYPPNVTRYVGLVIRSAKRHLESRAPQSAQKNINLQDLRPLSLLLPDSDTQAKIAATYEGVSLTLRREWLVLEKLKILKQGLMTDLLTGRMSEHAEDAS